ncbi:hypothetical protein ACTU3I_12405 [Microbacterium sp. RD1]|uniref:hypothetical protein n=1 Tax=Microbacterium sp. RD1 TaxID=3457313 RepID=UPI003FA52DFD
MQSVAAVLPTSSARALIGATVTAPPGDVIATGAGIVVIGATAWLAVVLATALRRGAPRAQ